jgi:hypothetical protein
MRASEYWGGNALEFVAALRARGLTIALETGLKSADHRSPEAPKMAAVAPEGDTQNSEGNQRRFQKLGDTWSLQFDGRSLSVKHMIGMAYTLHLLRSPGRSFKCVELQAVERGPSNLLPRFYEKEGTGREHESSLQNGILDAKARKEYGERVRSIDSELREAQLNNDLGRAEGLTREKEFIVDQLQAATKLGGRARSFSDEREKARKAVSAAIDYALQKIKKHDPGLAAYLDERIHRGSECYYSGDGTPWEI